MSRPISLPALIWIAGELRRSLLQITRDEIGARIVYGVTDTTQVLPHSAVVLRGRRIVGWIVEMSWEDDRRPAGEIHAETIEAFIPAPNIEIDTRSDSGYLPALIGKRSRYRADDATPEIDRLCDASEAMRLTQAFGMIERFRSWRGTPLRGATRFPNRNGHPTDWKTCETLVAASKALPLARETVEANQRLPETVLVDAEEVEADRAAWRAAITTARTKGQRDTSVRLADHPPGPLSDASIYG